MHEILATDAGLRALADRDISAIYKLLQSVGVTQRDIAIMTGQTQSEVSEILKGRKVIAYEVHRRIADGLEVPRGLMGLAYTDALGNPVDYSRSDEAEELGEDVKRRALLASGGLILFDRPVLGKVLELPKRPEVPSPLPSRLVASDIRALAALTAELRAWAQRWGGGAGIIGGIAERSERLLAVDGTPAQARQRLHSILAQLRTVAGWASVDECLDDTAREHFSRAMSLAGVAEDPYWVGFALYGGGRIAAESGHPNDALKHYQVAHVAVARDDGRHANAPALTGWLHGESALELAALKHYTVRNELAAVSDTEMNPDSIHLIAQTHMRLGNLDKAQLFAVSAVEKWQGLPNRRHAVIADITLAMVYLLAGEPRGLQLAQKAIASVGEIRSARARERLRELVTALESRSGSDYQELAARARRLCG